MFATVGATLPFERLVRSVAELKAAGDPGVIVLGDVGWSNLEDIHVDLSNFRLNGMELF